MFGADDASTFIEQVEIPHPCPFRDRGADATILDPGRGYFPFSILPAPRISSVIELGPGHRHLGREGRPRKGPFSSRTGNAWKRLSCPENTVSKDPDFFRILAGATMPVWHAQADAEGV